MANLEAERRQKVLAKKSKDIQKGLARSNFKVTNELQRKLKTLDEEHERKMLCLKKQIKSTKDELKRVSLDFSPSIDNGINSATHKSKEDISFDTKQITKQRKTCPHIYCEETDNLPSWQLQCFDCKEKNKQPSPDFKEKREKPEATCKTSFTRKVSCKSPPISPYPPEKKPSISLFKRRAMSAMARIPDHSSPDVYTDDTVPGKLNHNNRRVKSASFTGRVGTTQIFNFHRRSPSAMLQDRPSCLPSLSRTGRPISSPLQKIEVAGRRVQSTSPRRRSFSVDETLARKIALFTDKIKDI